MRSIGGRCKACERLSRAVLIARALLPVCIILRGCIELRDRSCRALCNRQGGAEAPHRAALIQEPRGSAPRERDHRGGDHPVPSRTRQLSPPSPRVLQREAAGGQGVALAEGAFLLRRERPAGGCPPAGLFAFGCRKMLRFSLYALREIVVCLTGANLEFGTMKSLNLVTLTQRGNA